MIKKVALYLRSSKDRHDVSIDSQRREIEKFALVSQINRSVVSIPSNIAEGTSRRTIKEVTRFLNIALGSSYELETQLLLIANLYKELESESVILINKINEIQKMIGGFKKKINQTESLIS